MNFFDLLFLILSARRPAAKISSKNFVGSKACGGLLLSRELHFFAQNRLRKARLFATLV